MAQDQPDNEKTCDSRYEARRKIDWSSIKVKIVSADKDHPNPSNPYAKLSPKEREKGIVSLCAKIWVRHIRAKLSEAEGAVTKSEPASSHASTPPEAC